jgi:N-acetylglucosaminyl-diphospho-decaprenol L-rhamnosyltransferase
VRVVTVSIVSHGHEHQVGRLLDQLRGEAGGTVAHVIVTHNLPAAAIATPAAGWPFRFTEVFNEEPRGFSLNHNQAFAHCETDTFCVLNPDMELPHAGVIPTLLKQLQPEGVACAYPQLLNADGSVQQNARELVTPWSLLKRHLFGAAGGNGEWASGSFWLVRSEAWRDVGGLDEKFFMYCEDVDFCLRLRMAGWKLRKGDVSAVHDAGWGSRRVGRPLLWHLKSLLQFWTSPVFWHYLTWRRDARRLTQPRH